MRRGRRRRRDEAARAGAHIDGAGVVVVDLAEDEVVFFARGFLEDDLPSEAELARQGPVGLEPVNELHCGNFPALVLVEGLEVHYDV